MARRHLDTGHPKTALQIIQNFKSLHGHRITPDIQALVTTTEAWIHAHQGNEYNVRRSLDEAHQTLTDTETFSVFGMAEFSGVAGACFEMLAVSNSHANGHLADAERYIRDALQLRDAVYIRSRALDYAGLANVRLTQGEPEQACIDARHAIELSSNLRSARVTNRIHQLTVQALERFPDSSAVWELADQVRLRLPLASTT